MINLRRLVCKRMFRVRKMPLAENKSDDVTPTNVENDGQIDANVECLEFAWLMWMTDDEWF